MSENGHSVLLVDDEPLILEVCGAVLRSSGYSVICSANGVSGLNTFRKNSHRVHLVISDIVMPELNGLDMTHQMLAEKPDLKIIYMSGYGAATVLPNGNDQFRLLVKPFTSEQFLTTVRNSLAATTV